MAEEKKKSHSGCFWFAMILGAMIVIAGVLVVSGIVVASRSVSFSTAHSGMGADESPNLKEIWAGGAGKTKVVRIPLRGLIMLDTGDGFFGPEAGSADMALRSIHRATHDSEVQGIILDVDSGGGGITASDILYKALLDFKEEHPGRKVVAILNDVAASGAYYVALASDHIIAHPTTITGSIGVLIQSLNVRELGDKIGVKDVTIKSGPNKDILNPFRDLTDEQWKEQKQMLQSVVNELHDRFVGLVAENRDLPEDEVRELADGRIFTASKAEELGLIDEQGYWRDAKERIAELLGVDEVKIFRYEESLSLSSLFRVAEKGVNPLSLLFNRLTQTRLMYLWQM